MNGFQGLTDGDLRTLLERVPRSAMILIEDLTGISTERKKDHVQGVNLCMKMEFQNPTNFVCTTAVSTILGSRNFIHRDIKPDNFLMGIGKSGTLVHAIDFGLAQRFRDPRTRLHIPYHLQKPMTGTARLPWEDLRVDTQEQIYDYIMVKKMTTATDLLCRDLSHEFGAFLDYTRHLGFEEEPDYSYW
ncbi:kinase-like domain-containing protein [Mycena sp. CBHHK59/15]|nr:kinase-like domain-containing protein [Mycena sp. CBHHK59/15]